MIQIDYRRFNDIRILTIDNNKVKQNRKASGNPSANIKKLLFLIILLFLNANLISY